MCIRDSLVRVRRGAGAESRIQVGCAAEPLVRIRRLRPHVAPPGMPPAFRCDFRGGGASELWFVRMAVRNPSGDLKSVRDDGLKFLREAVRDLSGRWGGIPPNGSLKLLREGARNRFGRQSGICPSGWFENRSVGGLSGDSFENRSGIRSKSVRAAKRLRPRHQCRGLFCVPAIRFVMKNLLPV